MEWLGWDGFVGVLSGQFVGFGLIGLYDVHNESGDTILCPGIF